MKLYIPTAVSEREARTLARYSKGLKVVEAGSLLGFSTIAIAKSANHVISIDRHTGYNCDNDTFRAFNRNLDVSGTAGVVETKVGDYSLLGESPADFAFIDLDGTYETTLAAIRASRAPIIGVHDYARTECRGVALAVEASGLQVIERVDSLILLRKGEA